MLKIKKISFDNLIKLNVISAAISFISLIALLFMYLKCTFNIVNLINEDTFTNETIVQSINDFFIISSYILVLFIVTAISKSITLKKFKKESENKKYILNYVKNYDFFKNYSIIKKNIIENTREISKEDRNKILNYNDKKLLKNYKLIIEEINIENKKLLEDKKELERKVKAIDEKLNNKIKIINQ